MAFTTLPGASTADATSFIGTDGVDSIILTNVATRIWVLAQAAADRININISTQWGNYSLRGGQGNDTITLKGTTAESLVKADRDEILCFAKPPPKQIEIMTSSSWPVVCL